MRVSNPIGRPDKFDEHKMNYTRLCEELNTIHAVYMELVTEYQKELKYFAQRVRRNQLSRVEYEELMSLFNGWYPRHDSRCNL